MPKNQKPKFDPSQWFLIEEPKNKEDEANFIHVGKCSKLQNNSLANEDSKKEVIE